MKRLTFLFAVLAIFFGISKAAPTNNHRFASQFYSYQGGPVTSPSSYAPLPSDPGCGISDQVLCAVRVKQGSNPNLPDSVALHNLYVASGNFANPGTYTGLGVVEKKND